MFLSKTHLYTLSPSRTSWWLSTWDFFRSTASSGLSQLDSDFITHVQNRLEKYWFQEWNPGIINFKLHIPFHLRAPLPLLYPCFQTKSPFETGLILAPQSLVYPRNLASRCEFWTVCPTLRREVMGRENSFCRSTLLTFLPIYF